MPDQPFRRSDLRTPSPTLEPDDSLVAQLSALAAAGASDPTSPAPVATWRVGLAAAGVATVLVGVAWLAGLGPSSSTDPAPPPAISPSAPHERSAEPQRPPTSSAPVVEEPAVASTRQPTVAGRPDRPDHQGSVNSPGKAGNGPDEHAGDHPNEHATTKSNNAHRRAGSNPGQGPGGQASR